jgi:hypothetical protein
MNRTSYQTVAAIDSLKDPGWYVETVDDFDGDGRSDLFYRNLLTGANVIWTLNGTTFKSQVALPSKDVAWRVKGSGDFDGDGDRDVVFRNTATGETEAWFLNGTTFLSSVAIATVDPATYDLAGILTSALTVDLAGNSTTSAFSIGLLDAAATYNDTLGPSDINDYYSFTLNNASKIRVIANGTGLAPTTAIDVLNANGVVVGSTTANGNNEERLSDLLLDPGVYYVRLASTATSTINYNISIEATEQLPVNLFFPTTPAPITLKRTDGTVILPTAAVSVRDPFPFDIDYNVTYTGRQLSTFNVAFFLSSDPTITTADYRFDLNGDGQRNSSDVVSITGTQPDTIISRTQRLTLPSKDDPFWIQDGIYYIGVILDPENEIVELDQQNVLKEDDNIASRQIRVRDARLPDLTPATFDVTQSSSIKGGQIQLTGSISNIGNAASDTQNPPGSQFEVRFYLSRDNVVSPGTDFQLTSIDFQPLAAGAQIPINTTVTLPLNWSGYQSPQPGNSYFVLVQIDPDGTLNEITGGTANNRAFDSVVIA